LKEKGENDETYFCIAGTFDFADYPDNATSYCGTASKMAQATLVQLASSASLWAQTA
jgi:hypothetical protein